MRDSARIDTPAPSSEFDYSTPEAQEALRHVTDLVLEIRQEAVTGPMARKIALYERSLGLAVLPVLLRKAAYLVWRELGRRRAGGQ